MPPNLTHWSFKYKNSKHTANTVCALVEESQQSLYAHRNKHIKTAAQLHTHTHTPAHTLPSFTYGARSPFKVAFTEHCADNDLGREGERDTDLQRPSHHKTRGKRIKLRLYSNSKDFNTLFLTHPPSLQ